VALVVSHEYVYGDVVTTLPTFAPSSWNCTPVTPTLSLAVAVTLMVPDTVAPLAGEVMETVGPLPPPPDLPVELAKPAHPALHNSTPKAASVKTVDESLFPAPHLI